MSLKCKNCGKANRQKETGLRDYCSSSCREAYQAILHRKRQSKFVSKNVKDTLPYTPDDLALKNPLKSISPKANFRCLGQYPEHDWRVIGSNIYCARCSPPIAHKDIKIGETNLYEIWSTCIPGVKRFKFKQGKDSKDIKGCPEHPGQKTCWHMKVYGGKK